MSITVCASAVKALLRDSESTVESVARVDGDGVLIKVGKASEGLVSRLRTALPLATIALAEDLIGSTASAHVLFPSQGTQRSLAFTLARGLRVSRLLLSASNCLVFMAVLVFATSVAANLNPAGPARI